MSASSGPAATPSYLGLVHERPSPQLWAPWLDDRIRLFPSTQLRPTCTEAAQRRLAFAMAMFCDPRQCPAADTIADVLASICEQVAGVQEGVIGLLRSVGLDDDVCWRAADFLGSGDLCRLDDRQQVEFLTSSVPHLWELPEVLTTGKGGEDGRKTPPDFASTGGRDAMFVGLARRIGLSVDQALILIEALERVVCRIDSVPGVVGFLCK